MSTSSVRGRSYDQEARKRGADAAITHSCYRQCQAAESSYCQCQAALVAAGHYSPQQSLNSPAAPSIPVDLYTYLSTILFASLLETSLSVIPFQTRCSYTFSSISPSPKPDDLLYIHMALPHVQWTTQLPHQ